MSNYKQSCPLERLAVPATNAAELLGISPRHFWNLHSRGLLPSPLRLGRSVRWSRVELEAWVAAGAPPRDQWESSKGGEQ